MGPDDTNNRQDGYNDGYVSRNDRKAGKGIESSNIKKIPKRQTAVALQEADNKRHAPRIKAAGRGTIAEKIIQLAYENGIHVRQDSALAEMLAKIDIDSPIPEEAFMAVAEILSYVYKANGKPDPFNTVLNKDDLE